ncbi:serine/threonine-protein kinase ULK1a [Chanos chanos]|uniref:non-specific serine/threonine protein kinase n=1 Tax=Chanos chanos TaxID=29144 RepID=A0A6J2VCL9_CHACN|nr:serine/threonine-protein kinase ULK1-like [Chanos chanos]
METVGKFEFSRKDLIGHGAFAVVFKGRHKQKHDFEVAVKCINKKNLAKSQTLLGKEIKILKELKHENIVGLLDFQEIAGCVYLVMEYCNGGDLAEYLHSKGSLSEDTIRAFLQQIAGAMSVLRGKGIIHRDLKPQNILLSYSTARKTGSSNICLKIADFGFARYLQDNTMAATLCGSPMYMAPEVIMSQNYDAKADLWSVGTIVYQCLTGKAPFQASSPQELRLLYERHRNLSPSIPRETSTHLRQLLLGLLQRNHKDRMDFDEFFHHPFLEASTSIKKSSPVPMPSFPGTGSGSSSSSSSTSHTTPTQSDAELQKPHPLPKATPSPGSLLKDSSGDTEDFVMVPAQITSDTTENAGGQPIQDSQMNSGNFLLGPNACVGQTPPPSPSLRASPSPASRPVECCGSSYSQSVPVPVPTQIHNYHRLEQNLQCSPRTPLPMDHYCGGGFPGSGRTRGSPPSLTDAGAGYTHRRMSTGGSRPIQCSPRVGTIPEMPDQSEPQGTLTEQGSDDCSEYQQREVSPTPYSDLCAMEMTPACSQRTQRQSPDPTPPKYGHLRRHSTQTMGTMFPQQGMAQMSVRTNTVPNLSDLTHGSGTLPNIPASREAAKRRGSVKRSLSTGRLSDMLLKAVFGAQLDRGSSESLNTEKPMETTASPGGSEVRGERVSGSPVGVMFTLGSSPYENMPPHASRPRRFSEGSYSPCSHGWLCSRPLGAQGLVYGSPDNQRYGYIDTMATNLHGDVAFEPPELPEETLMEQGHTDMLGHLRFTLAFTHCVMEIARAKDCGIERSETPDASFLEQSVVADQISQLSREWGYAEQLVLYMKCAELLSTALQTAMENIKQGKLHPSGSVKQVVRKLNELYKACVTSCRSLNVRLQLFFSTKQRLMDRINNITAERLIYSHTVHMVQSAALDEMFHHGEASVQRYHKALLLMEGLSYIITERTDLHNIEKCKQCIERRLSSLQGGVCV